MTNDRSFAYDSGIDHFQSFLESLLDGGREWRSPTTGKVLQIRRWSVYQDMPVTPRGYPVGSVPFDRTQMNYRVTAPSNVNAGAVIEAYDLGGRTKVRFVDGVGFDKLAVGHRAPADLIGTAFDEFYRAIAETAGTQRRQAEGKKTAGGKASGRPRNEADDWACLEVREKKRDRWNEVYPEWLDMIGDRRGQLGDSRETFKKATSPKRWRDLQSKRK